MNLKWSHAVLNVGNLGKMLDFYTNVMGFTVSDRGPMGPPGAPEIVFMSQTSDEHHQLAMVDTGQQSPTTSLNHFSFRVDSFDEVKEMSRRLKELDVELLPLSHGNTLSIYFSDPEKNGLEVFWDTPWHVDQPAGVLWDPAMSEAEALAHVAESFKDNLSFVLRGDSDKPFVNRNSQRDL